MLIHHYGTGFGRLKYLEKCVLFYGKLVTRLYLRPPIAPSIKINFDAAVFDARYFQVGYVAWDCTGVCRRWAARRIRGLVSPEIAEAFGENFGRYGKQT